MRRMKKMKKSLFVTAAVSLALSTVLGACSSAKTATPSDTSKPQESAATPTKLTFWTFVDLHQKYWEDMAKSWNKAHPEEPIQLEATTIPYDEMHSKLLIALQTKTGAPDLADIEQSKFPNFVRGQSELVPLDDIVTPALPKIVKSRVDIYSKNGKYYGIDYHVGATVIYYNKEILDKAGVNPDNIKLWSDLEAAGKQVLEKTGKPIITFEGNGNWSWWPAISQQKSDQVDAQGNVTIDNEINIKTMQFFQKLVNEKIAAVAPGAGHDTAEYFGYMNKGGAASVFMPFWFMGRFTDKMPDLKGKMIVRPMPAWEPGGNRSAGMGGTATSITNQSKNIELAKKFLTYSKLTKESGIEIWKKLGFDPIVTDAWTDPAMKESNKFTDYFGNDIFDTLLKVKNEIAPVNITDNEPMVFDAVRNKAMPQIFLDKKDPAQVLKAVGDELRKK
jgi:arabinosaccharide transport system substrate-binding protein